MQIKPEALLARIMKLENAVFKSNNMSWTQLSMSGFWAASGVGANGFWYKMNNEGDIVISFDLTLSSATPSSPAATLPSWACPLGSTVRIECGWSGTGPTTYNDNFGPFMSVSSAGVLTMGQLYVSGLQVFGSAIYRSSTSH
jgi:hypothetical protein